MNYSAYKKNGCQDKKNLPSLGLSPIANLAGQVNQNIAKTLATLRLQGLPPDRPQHQGKPSRQPVELPTKAAKEDHNYEEHPAVIVVNIDHPAYGQAVEERCVHVTVFRAIAGALAAAGTDSSKDMYDYLDDMIRFQAGRMKERKLGRENAAIR